MQLMSTNLILQEMFNVSPKNSIFQVHIFDKNLKRTNLIANLAVIFNGDLCFGSF